MNKKSVCSVVKNKALTLALFCTIVSSASLATGVGLTFKKDSDINRKKNTAMVLAIVLGTALTAPTIRTWKMYKELSK